MKPTIKIGIGGFAFTLEEDAYQVLDNYLKSLKRHFENNPESKEIISDVEIRIAELLNMRLENKNNVISLEDIQYIIQIIGEPKDFDDSAEENKTGKVTKEKPVNVNKRLYRDMDNSILGGVFGGLGKYFNLDPVLLRVIYVGVIFFGNIFSNKLSGLLVIAYFILWIVVPKAKTLAQKLSMTGADPSLESIENREHIYLNKPKSSGLGNVLKIIFSIILGLVCFSLLIVVLTIGAMILGIYSWTYSPGISEILNAAGANTLGMQVSLLAGIGLPILAICYIGFKLLSSSRFLKRDAFILCAGFLGWIGVISYLGGSAFKIAKSHEKSKTIIHPIPIDTLSDTLYITMPEKYSEAHPVWDISNLYVLEDGEKKRSLFISPKVIIKEDSTLISYKLEIEKIGFGETKNIALRNAKKLDIKYEIQDSLLLVMPCIYNKQQPWNKEIIKLTVTTSPDKKVIVQGFP